MAFDGNRECSAQQQGDQQDATRCNLLAGVFGPADRLAAAAPADAMQTNAPGGRFGKFGEPVERGDTQPTTPSGDVDSTVRQLSDQFVSVRKQVNDIYAANGRIFTLPRYQAFYEQQPDYRPNPQFKDSDLDPRSQQAVDQLMAQQKSILESYRQFRQANPIEKTDDQQLMPFSSERAVTKNDLRVMNADSLEYARNEIFARHGRVFDRVDLAEYFGAKTWYQPTTRGDVELSPVEKYNLQVMLNAERQLRAVRNVPH